MSPVRRIARPLMAATFVMGGLDQVRNPGSKAAAARPLVERFHEPLHLPNDPEALVRANGAAMAGAGTLFATGRLPRLSAIILAASLIPTMYAGNRFWQADDATARTEQRVDFMKNLGLLGGLLIASVDTEGRPGLAWRSRRASRDAHRLAGSAKRDARRATKLAKKEMAVAAHSARREAKLAKARVGAHSPL